MFRHLDLVRRKKKEQLAIVEEPAATPEAEPEVEVAEEPIDQRRRSFLFGLGATAAVAAMPTVLHSTDALAGKGDSLDPIMRRERLMDSAISSFQQKLKSPEIVRARNGTGPALVPMMDALRQFDRSETLGTAYDCTEELKRYAVQLPYAIGRDGKPRLGFIPASAGPEKYVPATGKYGNGFYWGRKDIFVTANHVIDAANGKKDSKKVYDIAFLKVSPDCHARPDQIIYDDPSVTDADIDGEYVSVLGIDPDGVALKEGAPGGKIYQAGAERLTREWVDSVFTTADKYYKERLYRSFMIEIPHGEATSVQNETHVAAGMSGSPVMMVKNKRKVFAGMAHSVYRTPEKSLLFFFGPETARHQFEAFTRNVASL